jgi:hypothetical protein
MTSAGRSPAVAVAGRPIAASAATARYISHGRLPGDSVRKGRAAGYGQLYFYQKSTAL